MTDKTTKGVSKSKNTASPLTIKVAGIDIRDIENNKNKDLKGDK